VLNGTYEFIGSDEHSVVGGISQVLTEQSAATLALQSTRAGNQLRVSHQEANVNKNAKLVLALVQKAGESNVRSGENAGRKLSHVQIVRSFKEVMIGNSKDVTIDLPADFNESGWELIGFVQNNADGHITAAAKLDFQKDNSLNK
jgi:hypothetical protein